MTRFIPAADWLQGYSRDNLVNDALAAVIVTIMLIPQSLAYALLAGLPAEMGLYASILPLIAYALFGSSRTLSVGPVAVASLMTASAIGAVTAQGDVDYATAATVLALLGGVMLIVLGLLKFGFVANFLSHPVVSGFITASGVIIALGQLGPLMGVSVRGDTLPHLVTSLMQHWNTAHGLTALIGLSAVGFLLFARYKLANLLHSVGLSERTASLLVRSAPVLIMLVVIPLSYFKSFAEQGVPVVGYVPTGLPAFSAPHITWDLVRELAMPAFLIALIGFVESVSVGKTLGAKKRQRIDSNQELVGLGAANAAAALSGGFPVTGGFSRSVVNFDAGADTQMASVLTAIGIALAALLLTPALYFLPKAVLAATIIVAVLALIDWNILTLSARFSHADFAAVLLTILITLMAGVEFGVLTGVAVSIGLHLYQTSRPHFAVVGQMQNSEHYRNVKRHPVLIYPEILSLRVDESLYFANASYLEDILFQEVNDKPALRHVVLMCPAVNRIDLSALEALERINARLQEQGITLHMSEVKGPVMDALKRSDFLHHLTGQIYLSQHAADLDLRGRQNELQPEE
ncbi:MAG: sodium-independent anion transporter [Halieaceae bacterium]|nr:sodium-independent anion transporter [Halieaceae bacterium]